MAAWTLLFEIERLPVTLMRPNTVCKYCNKLSSDYRETETLVFTGMLISCQLQLFPTKAGALVEKANRHPRKEPQ
jgi:hypothetical protein